MKSKHSKALALLTVLVLLLASLLVNDYAVSADQVPGSPEDVQVPKEEDRELANPVNALEDQGNALRSDANYGIILGASDLKNTTFDELAFSYYEPGFKFSLYKPDDLNTVIQESQPIDFLGLNKECFSNLIPGDYLVKITQAPEKFQNYKLDKYYQLKIKDDGNHQLELYQKDGAYHLTNTNGSSTPTGMPGWKTPFIIPIAKDNLPEKFLVVEGQEQTESEVGRGEIIEFRIRKKISPDHNTVLNFPHTRDDGDWINFGCKADQSFDDYLDKRLDFIPNSLSLTLDGQATTDYIPSYDPNQHAIHVADQSKPNIIKFDFSNPIVIPKQDQELVVSFKVKVTQADDLITNTVGNSTVKLLPIKVEGHKTWQDNDNQDKTRPDSITIRLLADGVEVAKKQVTASDNWSWSFSDLPRVDSAGREISYTIQEDKVDQYDSVIEGYDVTNTYKPTNPPPTEPSPTEPTVEPPPELTVAFPQVFKMINGEKPSQADAFTFQLEPISYRALDSSLTLSPDQLPMPRGSEAGKKLVTITGEGVSDFGEVTYTRTGIYTYRITEVVNRALPYQFSNLVYTLVDQVYEEGGQLVYQRTLTREGSSNLFTTAYFTNVYTGPSPLREQATSLPATGEKTDMPFLVLTALGVCLLGFYKKRNF